MMLFYILIGLFGLCVGSFLNVVIFRLHSGEAGIVGGKSHCQNCEYELQWYDLVPVFSWLSLFGKCRKCRKPIKIQYPLVELSNSVLWVGAWYLSWTTERLFTLDFWVSVLFFCILFSLLLVIFVYDVNYMEIPDEAALPAIFLSSFFIIHQLSWTLSLSKEHLSETILFLCTIPLGILLVSSFDYTKNTINKCITFGIYLLPFVSFALLEHATLKSHMLGVGIITAFFALQFYLSDGKIMGGGDIRIGVLMGLLFGWKLGLVALFVSYILGAFIGVAVKYSSKERNSMIPLGPFLCMGIVITLFWGVNILQWYMVNFL
jgi:leader peptidase (prepilin peptidase)/N-methyltransferase